MYSSTGRKNGTFGCNPGKGGSYPSKLELRISTDHFLGQSLFHSIDEATSDYDMIYTISGDELLTSENAMITSVEPAIENVIKQKIMQYLTAKTQPRLQKD